MQSERRAAARVTASTMARCVAVRRRRRRDVDRLLEERAVERIGLVEDGKHVQRAVVHQPLERVLASGDEPFDQRDRVRVVPLGAHVGRSHSARSRSTAAASAGRIVGAHHAAAARQRDRLQHTGIGDESCGKGMKAAAHRGGRRRTRAREDAPRERLHLMSWHTAWRSCGDKSLLERHLKRRKDVSNGSTKIWRPRWRRFPGNATRSSAGYENQGWKARATP